ncbi:rep protein, partial [Neisseria gonorrhoeae]
SRADYLAENSISRDKPWEHFGISRATWYRRGKPMPSETDNQSETA